jgi:hypothetical protein
LRNGRKGHRDAVGIHLAERAIERPRGDLRRIDEAALRRRDERRRQQVVVHVNQPAIVRRRLRQQRRRWQQRTRPRGGHGANETPPGGSNVRVMIVSAGHRGSLQ